MAHEELAWLFQDPHTGLDDCCCRHALEKGCLARWAGIVADFDGNGDGVIDEDEFSAADNEFAEGLNVLMLKLMLAVTNDDLARCVPCSNH